MREETLEEVAFRLYPEEWNWREKGIFKQGAKWQQERMYSEEEKELMIKIFNSYWFENNPEHEDNLEEWEFSKKLFEQFKKL